MTARSALVAFAMLVLGFACPIACSDEHTCPSDSIGYYNGKCYYRAPPRPPVKLDPPGPKDPDAAALASVFVGSCLSTAWGGSPAELLYQQYYRIPPDADWLGHVLLGANSCFVNRSDGCDAVWDCLGISVAPDLGDCVDRACDSDVAIECSHGLTIYTNCARLGRTCSGGFCSVPVVPCDYQTTPTCQDDGTSQICHEFINRLDTEFHCSELGMQCVDGLCVGAGPACDNKDDRWYISTEADLGCDGTTARRCVNGGERTYDCAQIARGFKCGNKPAGCGLASECIPGGPAQCDKGDLVLCNGGRLDRINCKSLGFDGCDPDRRACRVFL